jgi:hypothetical protein
MLQALAIYRKRSAAKERLRRLFASPEHAHIVHYSCESFYERPDGRSPRITSLAVRSLKSGQTRSFSIHQLAERVKCDFSTIECKYDELERRMLDEFYEFVKAHCHDVWLHWNMRDSNYGFAALGHRYRVLGGDPVEIDDENLVDLSRVLIDWYGSAYIGHPRLESLMARNTISRLDFLPGKQEAEAFERKDYVKLHLSTLRKVDVLANIATRAADGLLKTDRTLLRSANYVIAAAVEGIKEHWLAALLAGGFAFLGWVQGVVWLIELATRRKP